MEAGKLLHTDVKAGVYFSSYNEAVFYIRGRQEYVSKISHWILETLIASQLHQARYLKLTFGKEAGWISRR
jgi:hypothetical protein